MATKTDNGTATVDHGALDFTPEQIALMGPDLYKSLMEKQAKRSQMGGKIEAVSAALLDAAGSWKEYMSKMETITNTVQALQESEGTLADVPEYAEFRTASNLPVSGKGRNSNLAQVVAYLSKQI
jgi:hypothetical protein